MQAVGGALGLACLVTLALRHAAGEVHHGALAAVASSEGHALAFHVGSALLLIGGISALILLERVSATPRSIDAAIPSQQALRADVAVT